MTIKLAKTSDLHLARIFCALADQGGTIQADRLIDVFTDPRNHRTMTIREAWGIALPHWDADDLSETLWG